MFITVVRIESTTGIVKSNNAPRFANLPAGTKATLFNAAKTLQCKIYFIWYIRLVTPRGVSASQGDKTGLLTDLAGFSAGASQRQKPLCPSHEWPSVGVVVEAKKNITFKKKFLVYSKYRMTLHSMRHGESCSVNYPCLLQILCIHALVSNESFMPTSGGHTVSTA